LLFTFRAADIRESSPPPALSPTRLGLGGRRFSARPKEAQRRMAAKATSAKSPAESKPGVVTKTKEFLQEVRTEMMEKVSWPSSEEIKGQTQVVLFVLVALAALVGVYDLIFSTVMFGLLDALG
jgi:preprotein translocase SecE subunit